MSLYMEDYLELIEQLPAELRDRFTEMRELDLLVEKNISKNEELIKTFFQRAPDLSSDERKRQYLRIREDYMKTLEDADEKVNLANAMHTCLERHLRKLDTELGKFKLELEADNAGITEVLEAKVLEAEKSGYERQEKRRRLQQQQTIVNNVVAAAVKNEVPGASRDVTTPRPSNILLPQPLHISASVSSLAGISASPSTKAMPSPVQHQVTTPTSASIQPSIDLFHMQQEFVRPFERRRVQSYPKLQESRVLPVSYQSQMPSPAGGGGGSREKETSGGVFAVPEDAKNFALPSTPLSASQSGNVKFESVGFHSAFLQEQTRSGRSRKFTPEAAEMLKDVVRHRQQRHHNHDAGYGSSLTGGSSYGSADEETDPNEPRYCICNQVSYGEMVACDNKDCPFEWFHYACVGISQPPKGKWYCPQCTHRMRQKANRLLQSTSTGR